MQPAYDHMQAACISSVASLAVLPSEISQLVSTTFAVELQRLVDKNRLLKHI